MKNALCHKKKKKLWKTGSFFYVPHRVASFAAKQKTTRQSSFVGFFTIAIKELPLRERVAHGERTLKKTNVGK